MIGKIIVIALIASIAAVGLGRQSPYAVFILIGATVLIGVFLISAMMNTVEELGAIYQYTGLNSSYLKLLLKSLAIAFLAQFAADICEDAGFQSIASQIITGAKLAILLLSLPALRSLFEICIGMVNQ